MNVQYGCGLSAPLEWENYDASPTLRIQKIPLVGKLLKNRLNVIFPDNVKYGDVVKGLPVPLSSCDNVYCSHTLEHLSFEDCFKAIENTYKILKPGGVFRCVVPDMEQYANDYITDLINKREDAGNEFMRKMMMGQERRKKGLKDLLVFYFGNSHHLWMWDEMTLKTLLAKAGFASIRRCKYNDSDSLVFKTVEQEGRFWKALSFEAIK